MSDLDDEELKATRKLNGSDTREHGVYAIKFAAMQQQIDEKDKEIEKLKKFINLLQLKNVKDLSTKIYMANFINDNTPYTKDTKELENEEGTRTVDFTVKYFESKAEKE